MAGRQLRRDNEAVGQVVAFLVAGTIFLAAVATVLVVSQGAATDPSPSREAAKHIEAAGLADLLVGSAGIGWQAGPDGITRLGLAADNGSGLDPARLQALRGAVATSQANGKVDYEEALRSLGMDPDGTGGFHIRIYPVGLNQLTVPSGLRVGYVGDWTSLASVMVAPPVLSQDAMATKANVQLNASMFAGTALERQALRELGVTFRDRVYITATTPTILVDYPFPLPDLPLLTVLNIPLLEGDVYPDHKPYLDAVLPGRLARYDVMVIGSGVNHNTLVKGEVKDAVRDWVRGGGTLIVLGSDLRSTDWLKPLLDIGVATVNGAPTAPDVAHPLLKEPNDLAWTSYNSHGQGWDILASGSDAAYEDFSHVVIQAGKDVLAVSKDGAFGDGRLVLTTYRAHDIAGAIGPAEAKAFFENLVSYADRSALYLDYGGTVPLDQPVALAVRQSWLMDPVFGQVPVRVEVLAWG